MNNFCQLTFGVPSDLDPEGPFVLCSGFAIETIVCG